MRPSRRPLVLCALLLVAAGCDRFKKRRDFIEDVAAEVTTPIHARIIVYEYDVKPDCTETGVMRFRCFLQSEQQGCAYLELDGTTVDPVPEGIENEGDFRCRVSGASAGRRPVASTPLPSRGVELVADPTGTRLAWRAAPTDAWRVLYVLDGEFLDDTSSAGTSPDELASEGHPTPPRGPGANLDWAAIPTLGQRAGDLLPSASRARFGKLLELVRTERGENGVAVALAGAMSLRDEAAWKAAWAALSPGARDAFHQRVRELVEEGTNEELLNALNNLPELRPPDYADLLVRLEREALEAGLDLNDGSYDRRQWLEALIALGDPRAGPLGCDWIESVVSDHLLSGDQFESWEYLLATYEGSLVAIARNKTPCPWVRLSLEQSPCAPGYRCSPSGLVQTSPAAQEEYENAVQDALDRGVPEPPADPQHPLCSVEQTQRLVKNWRPSWVYPEVSDEAAEEDSSSVMDSALDSTGALLLAAAYAQGPLPPEIVLKNQRRLYRVVEKSGPPGSADEAGTSSCFQSAANPTPPEVACTVPSNLSQLRPAGCRLEIDDAKKVITVTPPKPPPEGTERPTREDLRHRD